MPTTRITEHLGRLRAGWISVSANRVWLYFLERGRRHADYKLRILSNGQFEPEEIVNSAMIVALGKLTDPEGGNVDSRKGFEKLLRQAINANVARKLYRNRQSSAYYRESLEQLVLTDHDQATGWFIEEFFRCVEEYVASDDWAAYFRSATGSEPPDAYGRAELNTPYASHVDSPPQFARYKQACHEVLLAFQKERKAPEFIASILVLQRYESKEIADLFGCLPRSVNRYLQQAQPYLASMLMAAYDDLR